MVDTNREAVEGKVAELLAVMCDSSCQLTENCDCKITVRLLQSLLSERDAERARAEMAEAENTVLRAALAVSKDPCVYCQLPKEEMSLCDSGFPGCGRADDMMGCPEMGAAIERDALAAKLAEAEKEIERLQVTVKFADRVILGQQVGPVKVGL